MNNFGLSNTLNTKKYIMITIVKNEHDFIEQWIEYNISLGIEHFLVLVDNIFYEQKKYDICDKVCQFDVALINGTENNYNLKYIPNAFYEPEDY